MTSPADPANTGHTAMSELTLDELRPHLIRAMLVHIPFDGWTRATVDAAAGDLGVPPSVARLAFPGAVDMIDAYIRLADEEMARTLDTPDFHARKIRERVTLAIRTRLEQAEPNREAIRRSAALLSLPTNLARASRLTWRTADAIWRLCGDRSTDFNHYSKRALAGAVYSATLFYWLEDESEGREATWAFLDRRIADVMRIEKAKARLGGGDRLSPVRFLGRLRYPVEGQR